LGHTIPNLAVIADFKTRSLKHEVLYIGEHAGVEKDFVMKFAVSHGFRVEVREIICGKMRRYFSFQNFLDFFKVPVGIIQSIFILASFKPQVVFSKGGYVSVPGVIACGFLNFFRKIFGKERIVLFVHESDVVPGIANRVGAKFADKIFVSFEESKKYFKKKSRVVVTGNPVRKDVLKGNKENGMKLCGFNRFKPVILVMGGSLGAMQINNLVWGNLDELLKRYQIVHIAGKGNIKFGLKKEGYKQFELLFEELKDVYAVSDLVVTRGGANSLAEIASMEKKAVVIPLGMASSRGDQIVNAKICSSEYGWQVLYGDVSSEQFRLAIDIAIGTEFAGGFSGGFSGGKNNLHIKAASVIVDMIYGLS